jgi:hypothetical protein
MSDRARIPLLVKLSLASTILGVVFCLPLLVRETHYTFVLFMFFGQPFLGLGFVLFAWKVFRDLRTKELL